MKKIIPVSIRIYRLIAAFLVVGAMTGAISLYALSRLKVNGPVYQQIVLQQELLEDTLPPPLYLLESYMTALQMLGESDPVVIKEHVARIKKLHTDFEERRTDWNRRLVGTPIGEKLNEELREHALPLLETLESEFVPAVQRHDTVLASSLADGKLNLLYLEHRKSINNLVELARENSQRDELAAKEETSRLEFIELAALATGLILIAIYGVLTVRSLLSILNSTAGRLGDGSAQLSSAANQVADSSQNLAAASSDQAAAVEETGVALEEIASMVRATASNAKKAKLLAGDTRAALEQSSQSMKELNKAMAEIDDASTQVARIIKNIDEIAFQTNILALNAAVEAARAGESGAGFAVVANEVRLLAQRSAAAARETAEKIEVALASNQKGLKRTAIVSEQLLGIIEKVSSTDFVAGEISTAAQEQALGLEQINTAIRQVERVSQNNVHSADQGSVAAVGLKENADSLQEIVQDLYQLVDSKSRHAER